MGRNKYLNQKLPPNASKGQKRLAEVLHELFCTNGIAMTVVYEQRLDDLATPEIVEYYNVAGMALDFYIKELKIGIEYQGEQHYKSNSLYGSSIDRDERKREFLQDIGVKLVEVPYTIGDDFTLEEIRELIFRRTV